MISQNIINQYYSCFDDNPKIVKRTYDWNGKLIQFKLCNLHLQDSDFTDFISEEKIQ